MSDFQPVAFIEEIPSGSMRAFVVEGRKIAVFHTATGFFAADNSCPHRGGPLAEGDLRGPEVTCPWHLWSFDVRTGATSVNPDLRLIRHEVLVDGDRVLIRLAPRAMENGP